MINNLFILDKTVSDIRDVFNLKVADPSAFREKKYLAKKYLLGAEWDRYEDVYLSFYFLSLSEGKNWRHPVKNAKATVRLETLLDLDLIDEASELKAPNEFAVHDIIRLRSRLLELLPAGTQLSEIGLGCAFLGFSIPLTEAYQERAGGSEQFRHDLQDQLFDFGWKELEHRFSIADYNLR